MSASRGKGVTGRVGLIPGWHHRTLSWPLLLLVVAGLLSAVACTGVRSGSARATQASPSVPSQGTRPAATAPAASPTAPTGQAPLASAVPVTPSTALTLTLWGPDTMAPVEDAPGGALLAAQIASFTQEHPDWHVSYVRKKPSGPGGLVRSLQSTEAAAPQLLPDLVLLDMKELGPLASGGLLQPLEALLGPDALSDLEPFAREAGQVDDHTLAYQCEADVRFLAYNTTVIGQPPTSWAEIMASGSTYLLPIGATEGAVRDSFLPQYLALGGKLTDRDGQPYLDRAVVTAILETYQAASQAGLLPGAGFDLKDAGDCWPIYLTSKVAMTNANSRDYGRERTARLMGIKVGPLPTFLGTPVSLSDGYGYALITKNPQRQAAAVAFLRYILQPEVMAASSRATAHLPTRRSALPLAVTDPDYLRFLQKLLEVALPQPREPIYSLAVEALRPAIEAVTRGTRSPEAAASEAIGRMRNPPEEPTPGSQP